MLATCYYTRSPYCCCVATIVHTGDQLPDPRLVSRALISREARVSHFAPRETTLPPRASDCPIPTNGRPILPNSPGSRSHPNTLPVRRCSMQHDDKPIGRQPMALRYLKAQHTNCVHKLLVVIGAWFIQIEVATLESLHAISSIHLLDGSRDSGHQALRLQFHGSTCRGEPLTVLLDIHDHCAAPDIRLFV